MTHSDAITRRRLMKAGLIVAGAPFCAEALFDRRAAVDDEKLAEVKGHNIIFAVTCLKALRAVRADDR